MRHVSDPELPSVGCVMLTRWGPLWTLTAHLLIPDFQLVVMYVDQTMHSEILYVYQKHIF